MSHSRQFQYLLSAVSLSAVPRPFVRSPKTCPQCQYFLSAVPIPFVRSPSTFCPQSQDLSAVPIPFVRSPNAFCPQPQYLLSYVPLSAVPVPFVRSPIPCPQCLSSGQTDLFTCHTSTVYMHSHRGIRRIKNTLIFMMIINLNHKPASSFSPVALI